MQTFPVKKHEPTVLDGNTRIAVVKITPEGVQFDTEAPIDAFVDEANSSAVILSQIRLLTLAEVAQRLGISVPSTRKAIRHREITHYRFGVGRGTIRVDTHDADQWIEGP